MFSPALCACVFLVTLLVCVNVICTCVRRTQNETFEAERSVAAADADAELAADVADASTPPGECSALAATVSTDDSDYYTPDDGPATILSPLCPPQTPPATTSTMANVRRYAK